MIATIVAPAMLFAGAAYTSYVRSFDEARERLVRDNDIVYEHAAKVFETHGFVLQQVIQLTGGLSDDQIRASEKRLHAEMAQMIAGFPQIKDVFIHDRHGVPLVSTAAYPISPRLAVANRDYFQRQAETDAGVFVSRLWPTRFGGMRYFTLTRRRPSADGSFNGIISVSIRPAYFQKFYRDVAQGDDNDDLIICLNHAAGPVLVRFPQPDTPRDLSNSRDFMENIAAHPHRGYFEGTSAVDGVTHLVSYRKLPAIPIYVSLGMPRQSVVHGWMREMGGQLIYGLPATLGLFLITLVALRRTERAAEEIARREQAEAALRQAQKLEAIGQLTGGIAHDFNNLLAVISGSLQLLRRNGRDPGKFLDAIERATRRGERLTRQLLTFSRQRRTRLSVIDLKPRLPNVADMLGRSLRGDIRLRMDVAPDLWLVDIDGDELELALLNLAINAQDAMPRGGTLTITARNVTLGPDADDGTGLTGEFVAVAACDTGTGMAPEIAARAFEQFFTTKPTGKGSGLGLSQVGGFARHCGGTAVVRSAPGKGTCIRLYLPKAGRATAAAPEPAADAAPAAGVGDVTVLLVEDDPEVRDTTAALLEDIGCRVEPTSRASEAQELVATSARRFDLVLSDIVMPDSISGIELARELRARHPDLPVVLMTGYSSAAAASAREGQAILFKPFTRIQLEAIVREHARTRRLSLTPG